MDKNFFKYFKDKGNLPLIIAALTLGVALLFIGNVEREAPKEEVGMEERIAAACSEVVGVGECEVLIHYSAAKSGEVESVIVICDGGDSVEVRSRLTSMLSAFFGIGANRIRVVEKSEGV